MMRRTFRMSEAPSVQGAPAAVRTRMPRMALPSVAPKMPSKSQKYSRAKNKLDAMRISAGGPLMEKPSAVAPPNRFAIHMPDTK